MTVVEAFRLSNKGLELVCVPSSRGGCMAASVSDTQAQGSQEPYLATVAARVPGLSSILIPKVCLQKDGLRDAATIKFGIPLRKSSALIIGAKQPTDLISIPSGM